MNEKIRRITIDLDTRSIDDVIRCLKRLRNAGFTQELTVRMSSSRKGIHVIAWSKKGVSLKKLLKLRCKAGDDRIRCRLDSCSGRQIQVLFTKKTKRTSHNEGVNDARTRTTA